jgi:monothiol glutaredoxin
MRAVFLRLEVDVVMVDLQSILSNMETNQPVEITAYLKTYCGWSEGVRAIMRKYDLSFEEKDIIKNPALRWEMEHKSGQPLSPCVEVNGKMLADVSGEEVEQYMVEQGLLQSSNAKPDAPIDSSCTDEQHEAMARGANVEFIKE